MAKASMKKMLEAGVHFGHRSRFWHPKMEPYIYGTRNGVHIINLEKTLPQFNDVLNFASKTASQGGSILFVGTKRAASNIIKEEAIRCGMPYVNHRWLGGMMTNYKTIKASIKRLKDLEFLAEENFAQFTKKEALVMTREMEKLERSLGGIKDLGSIPDVVFVVDIGHEKNAVREARTLRLPIIGVVDSNHNPEGIDYVIAGNDDSIRAISYYARKIADAVLEAKASIVETKPAAKKAESAAKKPAVEQLLKLLLKKRSQLLSQLLKLLLKKRSQLLSQLLKLLLKKRSQLLRSQLLRSQLLRSQLLRSQLLRSQLLRSQLLRSQLLQKLKQINNQAQYSKETNYGNYSRFS